MGFTGLARWINAPTSGLELVDQNITRNHHGQRRGNWFLSVRSFRSTLGVNTGLQVPSERTMCALSMNENVFVLLEDPSAPTRADVLAMAPPDIPPSQVQGPSHYRTTFITLKPPGALEQLLAQLRARWLAGRQAVSNASQRGQPTGHQLTIEGHIYSIGSDWLVRVGNVILAGGAVKGMLLEAEYLPLPVLHSQASDGTSELLSNLLTSVLPNIRDAKTVAVTISDSQWEEVLWDREEEERAEQSKSKEEESISDEIYVSDATVEDVPVKGDWTGVERDRRSAFLIIGALKSEGIL